MGKIHQKGGDKMATDKYPKDMIRKLSSKLELNSRDIGFSKKTRGKMKSQKNFLENLLSTYTGDWIELSKESYDYIRHLLNRYPNDVRLSRW